MSKTPVRLGVYLSTRDGFFKMTPLSINNTGVEVVGGEPQEAGATPRSQGVKMTGEHVLICVAWPYANGPLHLGHVAGCYLPLTFNFVLNAPSATGF